MTRIMQIVPIPVSSLTLAEARMLPPAVARGGARAYLGPYPIRSARAAEDRDDRS